MKIINNKDSIQVVSPGNGNIKNVEISFGNTGQQGGGRSSGNVASSTSSLTCESTIYITILYEWHDYSLSYEGDGAWVAVAMYSETVINCFETGGSGSGSGNYYDPYGGSGGGGNYYDPYGGGTNNWWDYGTGWPYGGGSADPFNPYYDPYSDPNNPYYDPNNYTDWYPWWTGGGGGSNYSLEIFPDDSILGNYFDNDADFMIDDYDDTNYAQYESNQQWPIVNSIIPLSMFVEYDRRDCFILSQEQIGKLGYKISSYNAPGQTIQIYNEHIGIDIQAAKNGVSYLLSALQRGIPVIVGVDYKNSTYAPGRPDGSTDHFVVIVGSGSDSQGNYFTFYDNASNYDSKGASSLNKLYYNPTTGFIQGQTQVTYDNGSKMPAYTVTQIRKSK